MLKRNMIFLFGLFFLMTVNCKPTSASEDHTEKPEQEGYYLIYETDGETIAGYLYVHLPYIFSYDGDGNVEGIECRLNKQDGYFYSYESAKLTEKLFCVKEAEDDIFIENAEGKTYILKEAEKLPEEQQYAFVLKNGYYGVYDRKTEKLQRYLYILGSCLGYADPDDMEWHDETDFRFDPHNSTYIAVDVSGKEQNELFTVSGTQKEIIGMFQDGNQYLLRKTDNIPKNLDIQEMHGKWVNSETKIMQNDQIVIWERVDEFDSLGNPVTVTQFLDDTGEDYVISKRKFDCDGNIIRNEKYAKDGELDEVVTFVFDWAGNQLERCVYNAEGELTTENRYTYDLEGKLVREYQKTASSADGTETEYTYDDYGNLIQKDKHYSDGSESVEKWECRYEGDNLVWYAKLNNDGSASENDWTRYEYDSEGNVICMETPKNLKQDEYADGLLVYESNQSKNSSDELAEYIYEYDNESRLIREQLVLNGTKIWCYIYMYNERGQILRKIMAAPDSAPDASFDEKQIIYEYTYDAYGNVLSIVQGEVRTESSWVFIEYGK